MIENSQSALALVSEVFPSSQITPLESPVNMFSDLMEWRFKIDGHVAAVKPDGRILIGKELAQMLNEKESQ